MRPSAALAAKFAPLPKRITAASLIRRLPEKKVYQKPKPIWEKRAEYLAAHYPKDPVGDVSREANPLGSHIYFYTHISTKRVIYSLYRNLYNTKAMKQVTFMGKKTVPAHLRKDHWKPFLTASFTNPATGLKAFQHLRELRRLHETQYEIDLLKKPKRERSKILQDQHANSIADIAAICKLDVKPEEKVRLRWMNIYDNEYAAEWPENVTHDLETQQYIRYQARRMGKFDPDKQPEQAEAGAKEAAVKVEEADGVKAIDKSKVEVLPPPSTPPAAEETKKSGLWRW
ncbi:hypothetical protein TWF696_006312 [Orbilia brochopaga]|uniref:Large ribosomal subunit protein mL67 n=1 Tax=Orbilia brochopaga TaxID=3140254 RepID=A0AAV9UWS0_9PEZI